MIDHDAIAARVRQDRETGTPGPWTQDESNPKFIDHTDPNSSICWHVTHVNSHCGYPIDGSSSNARRIAALPDLENAYLDLYDENARLKELVAYIAGTNTDHISVALVGNPNVCERIINRAREALKGDSDE